MVVAAARVMCNRMADARDEDHEDLWDSFGYYYLEEAKAALEAAGVPEMLEALITLERLAGQPLMHAEQARIDARVSIAKATGEAA